MKILVTGSDGFIGRNLISHLTHLDYTDIISFDREHSYDYLDKSCESVDFVFHLAGVNRPKQSSEFMDGNYGLTEALVASLRRHQNTCPILMTSSIQAELNNPYGVSKRAGEDVLLKYEQETGASTFIYRLPNVFGKWCKPNYNSVVATFCHLIAQGQPITINDPGVALNLVYIDDVIHEFIYALEGKANRRGVYCEINSSYQKTLGSIAELIYSFRNSREERTIPDMSDEFVKKLYSTYLSYLPKDQFGYDLKMNIDGRGSFTEFIRTPDRGQVSINISKPGITKGNHWHHTKNEKFLVVSGQGVIRFRSIYSKEVIEYFVSGEQLKVIDIPIGYTHNIENLGSTDMVTVMWVNESFDPNAPDTYYVEV